MTLYLLPGVGCDARLFSRLDLTGMEVKVLEWPPFPKACTLMDIAEALRPKVDASKPHILAGVSMGGMVAQELALLTNPQKVVVISSWEGPWEQPRYARIARILDLPLLIRPLTLRASWPLKRLLLRRDRATDRLLFDMAEKQGATMIRRGVEAVLLWPGSRWSGPVVRIHGSRDHVTPLHFPVDHVVQDGPHIMVLVRAAEVSEAVRAAMGS
jgi:pimeloyl-ACP methyl ester carboxylesterase